MGEVSYDRPAVDGRYFVNTSATFVCPAGMSLSQNITSVCVTLRIPNINVTFWRFGTPDCIGKKVKVNYFVSRRLRQGRTHS